MEETISLQEIFEVIKKRMTLIITTTILTTLIAAIISFIFITPIYQSKAQFIVNQGATNEQQLSQSDIRTNVELISTYKNIIVSQAILDDVAQELNTDLTAAQLANKIAVSNADNSQVVNITVKDADASLATEIANVTMYVFQDKLPDLMNIDNVHVLSDAIDTSAPISPNKKLNIAIGFVLGLMIGIGLAFLLAYLDRTIHTEEDIIRELNIPVIGHISTINKEDVIRPPTKRRSDS